MHHTAAEGIYCSVKKTQASLSAPVSFLMCVCVCGGGVCVLTERTQRSCTVWGTSSYFN